MDTKDIDKELTKVLDLLGEIDFFAKGKAFQNINAKKAHKAFDITYELRKNLRRYE